MAIKFSQFNERTESTATLTLVGYDGNQNIRILAEDLFENPFISGTENTIAMFGEGGTILADSIVTQNAEATMLTVAGSLNVDNDATFDTNLTVTGNSTLNGNVTLGNESADLITQTGTLYLNGPVKDTTNALGEEDQILVSDAEGELSFRDLLATHVESAEVVKVPVKNLEGSPLTKGDPVYISGSIGASGRLEVRLADASNAARMPAVGLLLQDLGINEEGFVVITGKLRNLPTSPIDGQPSSPNDVIYVKGGGVTGDALTLIKPVGADLIQNMGKVGRASTSNDGTFVVSSILRTNDIPNLTPGKIWVGSTGNTIESSSITFTEATGAVQLNEYGEGAITGTAAYNLSVDESGNVIETEASVTGAGVFTRVAFWDTNSSLSSNADLYWDNINSRLGIGTNDPLAKLQVNGKILLGNAFTPTSTEQTNLLNILVGADGNGAQNGISFYEDDTGFAMKLGYDGVGTGDANALRIYDWVNSAVATFQNGGNVGIATTNPGAKLQVNGKTTLGDAFVPTSAEHRNILNILSGRNTNGRRNGISFFETRGAYGMALGYDGVGEGDDNALRIYNNSNSAVATFENGGNFGLGVTDPRTKLQVNGKATLGDAFTPTLYEHQNILNILSGSNANGRTNGISFHETIGTWGMALGYDGTGTDISNALKIYSNFGGSTSTLVTFRENGNVGIGIPTPLYQLQLSLNSAAKPTSSSWTVVSDERVKTNIQDYTTGLTEILQINPKTFDYNGKAGFDTATGNIGVIAQDVINIMPETINTYNAKLNEDDTEDTELFNFDSHPIQFALINAIKELNSKIEALEARIQTLEDQ